MTDKQLLQAIFPTGSSKIVSKTDKEKGAYVVPARQAAVLKQAQVKPAPGGPGTPLTVKVLGEGIKEVEASYYASQRKPDPDRRPELRIGQEFVSHWLEPGDQVFLGTDGTHVFASRLTGRELSDQEAEEIQAQVYAEFSDHGLKEAIVRDRKRPRKRSVTTTQYFRSPAVAELARRRADGRCEMPGCGDAPFVKDDGCPYLEVHHITPLAESGVDDISNVAALCPNCHSAQHHSADRASRRKTLLKVVAVLRRM